MHGSPGEESVVGPSVGHHQGPEPHEGAKRGEGTMPVTAGCTRIRKGTGGLHSNV